MTHLRRTQTELSFVERTHMQTENGSASDTNHANQAVCQGCLDRPDRLCAACGAPATIWTEAGDGRHAVAWCTACHELLLSGRPSTAEPLVYLSMGRVRASA
jgi:hypothetical protein